MEKKHKSMLLKRELFSLERAYMMQPKKKFELYQQLREIKQKLEGLQMDKLKMHRTDKVDENSEKIAALFPNAVTEVIKDGVVTHAIDFDVLRQELSDVVVDGAQERYQFTWPDKRK